MKSLYSMPLFKQGLDTAYCVPYSMMGIARYFGLKVSRPAMMRACKTHKKLGSPAAHYSLGIRKFGMKFRRIKFSFRNVKKSLDQGEPVVICYMVSEVESHFSTIIDARRDSRGIEFYLLNDTYYGRYDIPAEVLNYLMKQDESWARIVVTEELIKASA